MAASASSDGSRTTSWRHVARDRWLQASVVVALALGSSAWWPSSWQRILDPATRLALITVLALVAARSGVHRIYERQERRLWQDVSLALGCLLVARIAPSLLAGSPPLTLRLAIDLSMAGFYAFVVLAVERRPERRSRWRPLGLEETLAWPAVAAAVLGLLLYFAVIPAFVDPASYLSRQPSVLFFAVVDFYLTVRLARRAATVAVWRWRIVYALLALSSGALLLSHTLAVSSMAAGGTFDGLRGLEVVWLIALVLAARLRHQLPIPAEIEEDLTLTSAPRLANLSLTAALAFPVIHVAAYSVGWLGEASRPGREMLIIIWLVLLGGFAVVQMELLRRATHTLWQDRSRVEMALRRSEQALKLALERQATAARLQASEDRFSLVFRACPSAMIIARRDDGRLIEVNDSFTLLTGHSCEDAIDRTDRELGLWVDDAERLAVLADLGTEGSVERPRVRFRHRDGGERWMHLVARPIEVEGMPCVLVLARDETEHLQAIDLLRAQAGRLDAAQEAIVALDPEGRIRAWNRRAEHWLGWSSSEALGRNAAVLLGSDEPEPWASALRAVAAVGDWLGELRLGTRHGEGRRFACRLTHVGAIDASRLGTLLVVEPIEEEKSGARTIEVPA